MYVLLFPFLCKHHQQQRSCWQFSVPHYHIQSFVLGIKIFQVICCINFGLNVIILETCIGFIVRVNPDDENIGLKKMLYSLPKILWHSCTVNASDLTFPIVLTKWWITIKETNILSTQHISLDVESHWNALATTARQSHAIHKRR